MKKTSSSNPLLIIASLAILAISGFLIAEGISQADVTIRSIFVIIGIIAGAIAISLFFLPSAIFSSLATKVSPYLPTRDSPMQLLEELATEDPLVCYVAAMVFGLGFLYNTWIVQHLVFGKDAYPTSNLKGIIAVLLAFFFATLPSTFSQRVPPSKVVGKVPAESVPAETSTIPASPEAKPPSDGSIPAGKPIK